VFAGNENDRGQVHPFVRVMLGGLCVISDAATMLLQHPSVSGLKDDTGRSGSTGWNNAGRWRLNFTFCAGAADDIDHTRQLKTEKLNYGRKGEKFKVRWEKGVFVPVVFGPTPERAAANAPIDVAFLNCLNVKIAQGIQVGPNAGKNYAPSIFSRMPEASGYGSKALEGAMERMLSTGTVVTRQVGPKSKQKPILGLPTPLPTP
jgi:RecA-family ATPase